MNRHEFSFSLNIVPSTTRNVIILILFLAAYAFVSNMDYNDAMLAHGKNAAECETKNPTPETNERADT